MPKLSKFDEMFAEPVCFSNGCYVVSRLLYPTIEEANAAFHAWYDDDLSTLPSIIGEVTEGFVRFGCSSGLEDSERGDAPRWFGPVANKRGAKPVWFYGL